MLLNIFLLLLGYYIIKTVRQAEILSGRDLELAIAGWEYTLAGPELKAVTRGVQAILLVAFFVPAYGWLASRTRRLTLIVGVTLFFIANIEFFCLLAGMKVPNLGVYFYVWVGIFNLSIVAQFWSYASDIYSDEDGRRLFPVIAIGATLGAPLGSRIAAVLFDRGMSAFAMLHISAAALLASLVLFLLVEHREHRAGRTEHVETLNRSNGFSLLMQSPYLRLIALLLVLLNLVNTTGEYILDVFVTENAEAAALAAGMLPGTEEWSGFMGRWIGRFYGNFFTAVNLIALGLQVLVVRRLVKVAGIIGVIVALPVVALGAYGVVASGVGLAVLQIAKVAENAVDYSIMNTGRQMLWLPAGREEKYQAKQAADTFFVRLGDLFHSVLIIAGTAVGFVYTTYAWINIALVLLWLLVCASLFREIRRLPNDRAVVPAGIG